MSLTYYARARAEVKRLTCSTAWSRACGVKGFDSTGARVRFEDAPRVLVGGVAGHEQEALGQLPSAAPPRRGRSRRRRPRACARRRGPGRSRVRCSRSSAARPPEATSTCQPWSSSTAVDQLHDGRLVVHHQRPPAPPQRPRALRPAAAAATDPRGSPDIAAGSSRVKTVRPGSLSTARRPPCCSTMPYDTLRPRPVPSPTFLVVKNGSKTRGSTAGGMPGPLSATCVRPTSCRPSAGRSW